MFCRIVRGKHYGHPNPSRGQFVLNGGNPTAAVDLFEIPQYPVGTRPDENFEPELIYDLRPGGGNSANGMVEYCATGPLFGKLLIAYFSETKCIQALTVDATGRVRHEHPLTNADGAPYRFIAPIDVAVDHRSGRIYVADFGVWHRPNFGNGGSIWMLEPATGS